MSDQEDQDINQPGLSGAVTSLNPDNDQPFLSQVKGESTILTDKDMIFAKSSSSIENVLGTSRYKSEIVPKR